MNLLLASSVQQDYIFHSKRRALHITYPGTQKDLYNKVILSVKTRGEVAKKNKQKD